MATIQRFLSLYETTNLIQKSGFSGISSDRVGIKTGSRLVLSLYVSALSAGASVVIRCKNGFSLDLPFDEILTMTSTSVGFNRKVLTDFHNIFDFEAEVIGGTADFNFGITVNDNALATRIENAIVEVALSHLVGTDGEFDSIRIGDGTDLLSINPDGSINVNFTVTNTPITVFNSQASLASGSEISLVSYTVPIGKKARLQLAEFSGDNIAAYTMYKNGVSFAKRRTHHGSGLSGEFLFAQGIGDGMEFQAGDVIQMKVRHERPSTADFEGRLQILVIG